MKDQEQAKLELVKDFLTGRTALDDPTALYLRERYAKKTSEYETILKRLDQAKQMVTQMEAQKLTWEGALQECIDQLLEVISKPVVEPLKETEDEAS